MITKPQASFFQDHMLLCKVLKQEAFLFLKPVNTQDFQVSQIILSLAASTDMSGHEFQNCSPQPSPPWLRDVHLLAGILIYSVVLPTADSGGGKKNTSYTLSFTVKFPSQMSFQCRLFTDLKADDHTEENSPETVLWLWQLPSLKQGYFSCTRTHMFANVV